MLAFLPRVCCVFCLSSVELRNSLGEFRLKPKHSGASSAASLPAGPEIPCSPASHGGARRPARHALCPASRAAAAAAPRAAVASSRSSTVAVAAAASPSSAATSSPCASAALALARALGRLVCSGAGLHGPEDFAVQGRGGGFNGRIPLNRGSGLPGDARLRPRALPAALYYSAERIWESVRPGRRGRRPSGGAKEA